VNALVGDYQVPVHCFCFFSISCLRKRTPVEQSFCKWIWVNWSVPFTQGGGAIVSNFSWPYPLLVCLLRASIIRLV